MIDAQVTEDWLKSIQAEIKALQLLVVRLLEENDKLRKTLALHVSNCETAHKL